MTHVPSDGIYPVMGLHPHVVGGISLIVTVRFIPYPAFPPYDVKKLHPGLRPTSATYKRSCYTPAMLTMIMMMKMIVMTRASSKILDECIDVCKSKSLVMQTKIANAEPAPLSELSK